MIGVAGAELWSMRRAKGGMAMGRMALAVGLVSVSLVLVVLFSGRPAGGQTAADGACDPEIRQGLMDSATAGVQGDLAIIRDPGQGIRNPDSILDLSCLEELFDYGSFDLFYDPGASMNELLGLLQRQVCSVAQNAYRNYVGRPLDARVLVWDLEGLPGVDVTGRRGNFLQEPARAGDLTVNLENFRNSLGGE